MSGLYDSPLYPDNFAYDHVYADRGQMAYGSGGTGGANLSRQAPTELTVNDFYKMNYNQMLSTQYLLAQSGDLTGTYNQGRMDNKTRDAVLQAMSEAQANQMTWSEYLALSPQARAALKGNGPNGPSGPHGSTSSSDSTSTSVSLTSRTTARSVLAQALAQQIGRDPSQHEVNMFLKGLNATEKAHPSTSSSHTVSTSDGSGHSSSHTSSTSKSTSINPGDEAEEFGRGKQFKAERTMYQDSQYLDVISQMLGM